MNINIINFIKSYPVYTVDIIGDSVLLRGRSDEYWIYISSKSCDEFQQLIEGLDEDDECFAVLEDWMLTFIDNGRKIRCQLTSIKRVYDKKTPLPSVMSNVIDLSITDTPYIFDNSEYNEYISIEYIKDRIKNGIAFGIYEDGKLIAWAIMHDDGAICFLNVLEGYMTDAAAMIERLLKLGNLPFAHIEDNVESMNFALKLGFRK